jgi:heat shock protein HslJ
MRKLLPVIIPLLLWHGSAAGSMDDFNEIFFLSTWTKVGMVRLVRSVNEDVVLFGDGIPVQSIVLENGTMSAYITTHGPQDPACCPTGRVVQKYVVQERKPLKVQEDVHGGSGPELVTTTWKWQQTFYKDGRKVMPPNPDQYTLELLADGKVHIRADCNVGGGSYKLNAGRISIEITHSTRAACPPESMDQSYVRDLNVAAKYFLKDDDLYIELKDGAGTMSFIQQ